MRLNVTFATVVASLALLAPSSLCAGEADKRLDIYWVDVEGGAATLIVTPAGESVLIDTGNPGRRDPDRIVKMAAQAGLKQIDHLVITHYHVDHFGGAAALAQSIPVKTVYDNGLFEGIRDKPNKEYLEFPAGARKVLSPGDQVPLKQTDAPLSLHCLCARQKTIAPPSADLPANECCSEAIGKPIDNSDNANSIVLLLSFGTFRFYDGGDLTWNVEKQLVCPGNLVGKVDVYQVTHHGLDASNNPVLLKTLAPTVAVMNNGVTKGCEPYTFTTLKGLPSLQALYQVHRNERADSHHNTEAAYIANSEKDCAGNYIKLSVDPTGKTYTVAVPSTKHERTFQTK
jgi:competence protein ComEC